MKKLVLSAILASVCALSQAAGAPWVDIIAKVFDGTGDSSVLVPKGTSWYLFDATSGATTQEKVFDAWVAGSSLDSIDGFAAKVEGTADGGGMMPFYYGEKNVQDTPAVSYTYFNAVVVDNKIFLSNTVTEKAPYTDVASQVRFGNYATTSKTAPAGTGFQGAGYWSAVPEPTSALLMLLGMAGLAIRRRRA